MTCATILVSSWEKLGVVDATISPGSRSTPLALALAASKSITVHLVLDERSSGFFALGLSKISLRPTVVLTTSGTAATELRPAVTEAALSSVPLIVCTSDRPFDLHGIGAPQTVDQELLFRDVVLRCFFAESPSWQNLSAWSAIASQSYGCSMHLPGGRGPVHLNLPFREPLFDGAADERLVAAGRVSALRSFAGVEEKDQLDRLTSYGSRGLFMVGATDDEIGEELYSVARALGWPIVYDPRARLYLEPELSVVHADLILRSPEVFELVRPDVVVRIGESFSSKVVGQYLSAISVLKGGETEIVTWAPHGRFYDPEGVSSHVSIVDVNATLRAWNSRIGNEARPNSSFAALWVALDDAVDKHLERVLSSSTPLDDPSTAYQLVRELHEHDLLFVSSSMPIRDVEWFSPKLRERPRVVANRGANGIDGVVSSYFGARHSWSQRYPDSLSVLLLGDLAYLYDIGALGFGGLADRRGLIVVNDNDGGGIFSFLPQRSLVPVERFEQVFGTPHGRDLASITQGFGVDVEVVTTVEELANQVRLARSGEVTRVVVQRSGRDANVIRHEELYNQVHDIVSQLISTLS